MRKIQLQKEKSGVIKVGGKSAIKKPFPNHFHSSCSFQRHHFCKWNNILFHFQFFWFRQVYQGIDIPYPTCPGEGDFVYTVWVGVVFPKQHSGRVFVSLCQGQKCVTIRQNRYPSVWIGKEGKGTPTCKIASDEVIDDKKFQIKQVQVTDVMVKQRWSWKKPLTAKISEKNETSVLNLPEPLIILYKIKRSSVIDDPLIVIRSPNRSSSVIESKVISPKENMQRYGNLLYRYSLTCQDDNLNI